MRRSRPDPAANSERTGSFHLVSSQRLAMLLPAVLLDCSCSCGPFYPGAVPSSVLLAPCVVLELRPGRARLPLPTRSTFKRQHLVRQSKAHTLLPASWPAAAPLTACQTELLGPGLAWSGLV